MNPTTPTTYVELVNLILDLANILIVGILGFTFVYLVWKTIDSWILNAADETKRQQGKQYAVAAVLVFVIIVSAWGIVKLIQASIFGS